MIKKINKITTILSLLGLLWIVLSLFFFEGILRTIYSDLIILATLISIMVTGQTNKYLYHTKDFQNNKEK